MRLLWITRAYPFPAFSGDYLYSGRLLKAVASCGISVHGVGRAAGDFDDAAQHVPLDTKDGTAAWTILPKTMRPRLGSVPHFLPSDSYRLGTSAATGTIRRLISDSHFDWVALDTGAMGWALDPLKPALQRGSRLLYISNNHEKNTRMLVARGHRKLHMRIPLYYDAYKYGEMEGRILKAASLVTTITEADRDAFASDGLKTKMLVARPGYDGQRDLREDINERTPRRIVILGHFQWVAKQENLVRFAEETSSILEKNGVGVSVVGRVEQQLIDRVQAKAKNVEFLGRVDDLHSVLRSSGRIGVVAEALGGGFKLKTLDYVFSGLPVAGFDVALEGLPLLIDSERISASSFPELAHKLLKAIDDYPYLNQMRRLAFERVLPDFDWLKTGQSVVDAMTAVSSSQQTVLVV